MDKSRSIKAIHLDQLRKKSKNTKKIYNISTKLSLVEIANRSFGFPSVVISDTEVFSSLSNDDHAPIDAAESQVPVAEKSATDELIVDPPVDNDILSPDWNFSDGLYDDIINLSTKSSLASPCGSFDDYLEIVNDMKLDELDEYLARATARESTYALMLNEAATATNTCCDDRFCISF